MLHCGADSEYKTLPPSGLEEMGHSVAVAMAAAEKDPRVNRVVRSSKPALVDFNPW